MDGRIEVIVDGGPSGIGVESTVVDATSTPVTLLRPGGVTREDLMEVLGALNVDPALDAGAHEKVVPRSPGLKYTHYAPKAPLTLVIPGPGGEEGLVSHIWSRAERELRAGRATGLLLMDEDVASLTIEADRAGWAAQVAEVATEALGARAEDLPRQSRGGKLVIVKAGSRTRPAEVATRLFAALRRFDELGVDAIIAEGLSEEGLGFAVMNRLRKASGGRIVHL
jgi:L-threonylcarbamoyladenylate synthase